MIAANDERIALVIETQAKLEGLRAARTETQAYAKEVQAASNTMRTSGTQAQAAQEAAVVATSTQINKMIGAFQAQGKLVDLTSAQAVAAYRREGDALAANLAALGATEQEINRVGAAIAQLERQAGAAETAANAMAGLGAASAAADEKITPMNSKLRSAASGGALLAQAAVTGQGSIAGLANAAGLASMGIAAMATSAEVAAAATGIGALITVAAVLVGALVHVNEAAKATQDQIDHLGNIKLQGFDRYLDDLKKRRDAAMQQASEAATGTILDFIPHTASFQAEKDFERLDDLYEQAFARRLALRERERQLEIETNRSLALSAATQREQLDLETQQSAIRASQKDSVDRQLTLQVQSIAYADAAAKAEIRKRYELRDIDGNILQLTEAQRQQRDQLLAAQEALTKAKIDEAKATAQETRDAANRAALQRLGMNNPEGDDLQAQLDIIQQAKEAAIAAGEDRVLAEQEAQQKIRALQKARFDEAKQGYAAMSQAALFHGSIIGKVAGVAARAIAIYEMIPQAKKDVQKGKSEAAQAFADFATPGKQASGAMHLLASGAFFAAAAYGFAEAAGLGGGGGGSAGGASAGGGAAGGTGTFEPVGSSAGGGVTINLITRDPYGREAISQTLYELNRSQVLKRPIPIAPTTGLVVAGAH